MRIIEWYNTLFQSIKNGIKRTSVYYIIRAVNQKKDLRNWKKSGRPVPPPHLVKQRIVKEYARRFSMHTLIETGTYFGDMVYSTKDTFSRIFSIELDKALYERAKKRFSKFHHISIIQGDSSEMLPDILANITQPCLFWLDAHYSGGVTAKGKLETPSLLELHHILDHPIAEHVILIDDARCFVGKNDYPTIEDLRDFILKRRPGWVFYVKDDIIRIHKRSNNEGRD